MQYCGDGFVSHLRPHERRADIETRRVRARNPVLIHFHQFPDTVQQLGTIETLQHTRKKRSYTPHDTQHTVLTVYNIRREQNAQFTSYTDVPGVCF